MHNINWLPGSVSFSSYIGHPAPTDGYAIAYMLESQSTFGMPFGFLPNDPIWVYSPTNMVVPAALSGPNLSYFYQTRLMGYWKRRSSLSYAG